MGQEGPCDDKPVELEKIPIGGKVCNVPEEYQSIGSLFLKVGEDELRYLSGPFKNDVLTGQVPNLLVWPVRQAPEE